MQLKIYQENAIEELLEKAKKLLAHLDGEKLVFKAPTGSGKTIVIAEFLKRLVDDREIKKISLVPSGQPQDNYIFKVEKS